MVNNLPANAGDTGLIFRSRRFPEKEMSTHSSILAWEIPWTEEPGRLQSMGLQRVGPMWLSMYTRTSQASPHCFRIFPLLSSVIINLIVVSQSPLKFHLYLQFPHGVSKLTIWLSYSIPAPWTEEPGGLQFMRSQRVRHDWYNPFLYPVILLP